MHIYQKDLATFEANTIIDNYINSMRLYQLLSIEDEDGKCIAQCLVPPDLEAEDVWDDMYEMLPEADDFCTTDKEHRNDCPLYIASIYPPDNSHIA